MDEAFASAEARALQRLRISGSLEAVNDLVDLYRSAGEEERLRIALHQLIAGTRDLEARALLHVYLGQSYERGADWSAAIEVYRQGIGLEPCRPFAAYFLHNNLAYCLNIRGEYMEAARLCWIAISIDPLRHNAHKNHGVASDGIGNPVWAFRQYVQATLLEPGDGRALQLMEQLVDRHPEVVDRPEQRARLQACRQAVARRRAESDAERIARGGAGVCDGRRFGLDELEAMVAAARARGHDAIVIRSGYIGVPEVVLFDPIDADVGDWVDFEAPADGEPMSGRVILKHGDITLLRCEAEASGEDDVA